MAFAALTPSITLAHHGVSIRSTQAAAPSRVSAPSPLKSAFLAGSRALPLAAAHPAATLSRNRGPSVQPVVAQTMAPAATFTELVVKECVHSALLFGECAGLTTMLVYRDRMHPVVAPCVHSAVLFGECARLTTSKYKNPTWSSFEMGDSPVFWESVDGRRPTAGSQAIVYYHATALDPGPYKAIFFNGGFNGPIMCSKDPVRMAVKERGSSCNDIYSIRINIPKHALWLDFSFTDGDSWDGRYRLEFEPYTEFKGRDRDFFIRGLREELSKEGACEEAIFPDIVLTADRCAMPSMTWAEAGKSCKLDIISGCMNPESPNYNPLAVVDDGSCDLPK
eukprot:jgi/Mesvir1/27334/Mv07151-RA.1